MLAHLWLLAGLLVRAQGQGRDERRQQILALLQTHDGTTPPPRSRCLAPPHPPPPAPPVSASRSGRPTLAGRAAWSRRPFRPYSTPGWVRRPASPPAGHLGLRLLLVERAGASRHRQHHPRPDPRPDTLALRPVVLQVMPWAAPPPHALSAGMTVAMCRGPTRHSPCWSGTARATSGQPGARRPHDAVQELPAGQEGGGPALHIARRVPEVARPVYS
jgi:hypothetical protein